MANLEKIITLTDSQYRTLAEGGTITTSDQKTYSFDANALYVVPEETITLSDIDGTSGFLKKTDNTWSLDTNTGISNNTITIGDNSITLGAAATKGVTDNSSNADVTSSDMNLITARTLYYQLANKGYGTVTSVAASGSGGITISGSPITTSGTIAIGLNLSTAINNLTIDTSPAQLDDYLIAQDAGGGTTNTTYYRRKVSNVVNATVVKAALGTDSTHNNQFLRKDGTWQTPPYPVTSVAGNTGAITADALRTSLGLSNAMHFLGVTTTNISTGTPNTTATVSISGSNITASAGDVVLYGSQEYVWGNSKWNLLGDESSYKVKQTAKSDPTALTTTSTTFIDTISQDENGVITATKKTLPAYPTSFTITASTTDGLWDLTGTSGSNKVTYAVGAYSSKQSTAAFYTAATDPTLTTRLNYDGYLYATKLYSSGNEVLTASSTLDATKLSGTIPSGCYTNSRDAGYGKITPTNNTSTTSALTGNTTAVVASNYSENLKLTAANKWVVLAGTNSDTAGSDELKIAHLVPSSITNNGPTSNQTGSRGSTFNIPKITLDEAGHVTGISSITVSLPSSDNTDEKVKQNSSTTSAAYKLLMTTAASPTSGNTYETNYATTLSYNPSTKVLTNGTITLTSTSSTTANGYAYDTLSLGNSTNVTSTTAHSEGKINIYSAATKSHIIVGKSTTTDYTHTLPNQSGLLVTLNSDAPSADVGSTTKPVYISSAGVVTEASTYAGGTKVTLNGTSAGGSTASFYAPTGAGTSGQYLKSNGSGAPSWTNFPTIPSITLNGSSTTSPSFYAPTTAGTSGYYLKSNGSGAPTWTSFPTIPSITLNGSSTTSPSFYAPTSAGTSGQYLKSNGSGAPTWANMPAAVTATASGSGNVVTGMSVTNNAITYTLGTVSTVSAQIVRW